MMGESGISLDSAAFISAAFVFPIVVAIAGCAICRRLCGGSESEDEERQPLLTGSSREEPRVRIERVENEEEQHRQKEPERHSPHSHSVLTGEQPQRNEERIEETRQQESQPVVVAEAALIPDLLRLDEQEPERSNQTDPDILEPRPSPDNVQSPHSEEHKEVTAVTARAQQEQQEPLVDEQPKISNSEDVQKQQVTTDGGAEHSEASQDVNVKSQASTQHAEPKEQLIPNLGDIKDPPIATDKEAEQRVKSKVMNWDTQAPPLKIDPCDELGSDFEQKLDESTLNKDLQKETPQDMEDPLLQKTPDESHSTELQDAQTDAPATLIETLQQEGAQAVLASVESTPADKEDKVDTVVENKVHDDPGVVAVDQSHQQDVEAVAAIDENKERPKADERIEDGTKEQKDEQSTSTQQHNEEVKDTPDETEGSVEGQVTEPASKVKINFDVAPSFVKTIRTKAAKKDSKAIFGLTILNQELFIISKDSSDVEVYDSQSLTFKHQFNLAGLYDPVDIKSSYKHCCIYIFDWKGESNEILRVAVDGKLITKWTTGDDGGYISVTPEANVLLSVWDKSLLKEFTADGQLLHEIQLSSSISELCLAIKLSNGHFIISQGEDGESEHRVCLVDDKGFVLKSIGGKQGSLNGEFDGPNYLVVDESGFILVADQNNRRVVLLSPDLEFRKEVIQERDDLRYPVRLDLDRTSGRLFIADNDHLEIGTGWRDGRVKAFDFTILH